ncbi:hypothetical protein H4J45_09770 [Colwellia sp. BRX10-6]|uniref:hypothetical protein n=1 Tax=unclassified Colwellia TaxID=196834 RepID=UPI0015F5E801|nr:MULTISPECIES: hypothetical protein [unclassified Colwellia]MBA6383661.1 hypothetical protein [Colwellia sp. BRX10-9]MBA6394371.1 hypothetical protein [Colwellia sp. BRX10-6]
MKKTHSLLMSLTLASLSASASGSPEQSNDTRVSPKFSVGGICKVNEKYINSSLPLLDFANPVLDYKKDFLPNGVLTCSVIPEASYPVKNNVKHYYEVGNFQGFDYKVGFSGGFIHLSPSPKTSKWKINCKKDDMEDSVTCSMTKHNKTPLFVHLGADGETTSFGLVTDTYPNMEVAVKVGSNSKIAATSMAGLLSKSQITEQMKSSTKLITSYFIWPSKVKKVENHSIEGFNAALILMKKLYKQSTFN